MTRCGEPGLTSAIGTVYLIAMLARLDHRHRAHLATREAPR